MENINTVLFPRVLKLVYKNRCFASTSKTCLTGKPIWIHREFNN